MLRLLIVSVILALASAQERLCAGVGIEQGQLARQRLVQDRRIGPLFGIGLGTVAAVAATGGDHEEHSQQESERGGGVAEAAPPATATC